MSKELIWNSYILLILSGVTALWGGDSFGETGIKKPFSTPIKSPHWRSVWSKKMQGAISELALSGHGDVVLVATLPDSDLGNGPKTPLLFRLGKNGHQDWQVRLKSPVQEMDLSADATLAVTSQLDRQLMAYGVNGELLWSLPASCKPMILNSLKKILCSHDDPASSGVAFDVLDWKGKKLLSYPARGDLLALKVSWDEKRTALGFAQGDVVVLDSEFQSLISKRIEGEIIDVAVSSLLPVSSTLNPFAAEKVSGKEQEVSAQVAVLYRDLEKSLKITLLDSSGKVIQTLTPSFKAQQLEMSSQGNALYYYGNTSQGQWVGSVKTPFKQEEWKRGEKTPSDYIAPLHVGSSGVWMGYEKQLTDQRESHLLSLNSQGEVRWDLSIPRSPQSYIYTHRPVSLLPGVVVATDDGKLSLLQLVE